LWHHRKPDRYHHHESQFSAGSGAEGSCAGVSLPAGNELGQGYGPGAEAIASLTDYPTAKVLYMVRKGAKLYDGSPAPGLRIQSFIENDNETGTVNLMTADGLRLWDAAINYA